MPRFSISKMMADPAAKAAEYLQDESSSTVELDASARKQKRGSTVASSKAPLRRCSTTDSASGSLDEYMQGLESFALTLQKMDPDDVARAMSKRGSKGGKKTSRSP